ncbi:MAG TPA: hypothetical protein VHD60_02880 [Candidatus Saccharimonadales bacterium]|nr:hypothetical protein [Candidatus Saccharimonadales bacterium]
MRHLQKFFKRSSLAHNDEGFMVPAMISFIIAAAILAVAVLGVILNNFFVVGHNVKSQQAFNIAEAGVDYYVWHLSHNGTDYQDGQGSPATQDPNLGYGPYTHDYVDANGDTTGTYTLWIKPQGIGSTIVTVTSIGKVNGSDATRTVQAKVGATSFASYAVLSDSELWFGNTESADGPVHSNIGVHMDGANNDVVSSSNSTYVPSTQYGGDGSTENGVWCDPTITSPVNCNTRSKANWQYPTTTVDFNQISGSLCSLKKIAFSEDSSTSSLAGQSNACSQLPTMRTAAYVPERSSSANVSRGYLINLNNDGTYDLYTVNNEKDTKTDYSSALSPTLVASGISFPTNGVIFVEDNVWVRSNPTFKGRLTIASGRLATSVATNINIAGNVAYSTKDGSDVLGLVAEGSVEIAPYAAPSTGDFTLEIDAAMLAETGNVQYRPVYNFSWFGSCTRGWVGDNQQLDFYGSVATRQNWTWSWEYSGRGGCGDAVYDSSSGYYISGFKNNTTHYDYNLLYAPPPGFPVTGGYTTLSWREVLTKP